MVSVTEWYASFRLGMKRYVTDFHRQVTSTIPTWQAECARPEKRGRMIILAGAIISGGVMIVGHGLKYPRSHMTDFTSSGILD